MGHWCAAIPAAAIELARCAIRQFALARRNPAATLASLCFATLPVSMGVTGCMVGPNYSRPAATVSDTWLDIKATKQGQVSEDGRWWSAFNDATLAALIDRAR